MTFVKAKGPDQLPPTTRRLAPLPLADRRARRNTDAGAISGYGYGGGGVISPTLAAVDEYSSTATCANCSAAGAPGRTLRQPRRHRAPLGQALHSLDPLRTRRHRHHGPQRHRPRPLGSPRQGRAAAGLRAAGRLLRAPYPRLRLRRRSRMVRRDRFHRPQGAL